MKNFVLSVLFASLSFAANAQDIELNEVISKINTSLNQAQNGLVGVTLTGASVTFETISAKTGGGGFKIFVKASKK